MSVQITAGNISFNAIPIFVSPGLVNAVLPGNTPTGAVTLTVTHDGQVSNPVSFQVISRSFGIFTVNANGSGAGIITGPNYQLYSVNSPANPGDMVSIWGTGIGASPEDNGSAPPQQIDMPSLPLTVYVGTQAASVAYRGRAAFSGEDQINFVVPSGITGCYVPVVVEIGSIVSNFVTLPIGLEGQPCPDPAPPMPTLANPGTAITGNITLTRTTLIQGTTSTTDYGQAFFGNPSILSFPYVPPVIGNPYSLPAGTCIGGITFPSYIDVLTGGLDAGSITVTGPNGSHQLSASGLASQLGGGSGANVQLLYLSAGTYIVSGSGGTQTASFANVGPFSQSFAISPPLSWTNQADITNIKRIADLDITWSGGDSDGTVQITSDVGFICNAKNSDKHFTIPAFVLLSNPASGTSTTGYLTLGTVSTSTFTASGISSGTINTVVLFVKNVVYQ